jgi:rod shape-determining protein MreD
MVDPITWRRFQFRVLFLFVSAIIIFSQLLPLNTAPASVQLLDPETGDLIQEGSVYFGLPGPDLLFCLTAAFLMRRPRWAPVALIVVVHLMADVLFLRPLGLWPAISLLAYEFLRRQINASNEVSIPLEIALVVGAFTAAVFVNGVFHLIFAVQHPSFGATLLHILTTAIAYPFVIAVTHFILRVRRAGVRELDSDGVIG